MYGNPPEQGGTVLVTILSLLERTQVVKAKNREKQKKPKDAGKFCGKTGENVLARELLELADIYVIQIRRHLEFALH